MAASSDNMQLEPSDSYIKQRRAVIIASGLLFVATAVGIESPDGSQSLLPFKLKDADAITPILACIVIYNAYLFILNWSLQIKSIREKRPIQRDFRITLSVCLSSIVVYLISFFTSAFTIETINPLNAIIGLISTAIVAGVIGYFASNRILKEWQNVLNKRLTSKTTKEQEIATVLAKSGWVLNFNYAHAKGKKQIEFMPDGQIGRGKNNNETSWRLRDGYLELLNSKAVVHSRFAYIKNENKFLHTNDEDTLSLKPQEIYFDPNFRD